MIARRSFLKAASAVPLAAKSIADAGIAKLSGVASIGEIGEVPYGSGPGISVGQPIGSNQPWMTKIKVFLAEGILPSWYNDDLRERHTIVRYLDPDIACKKSWSMSVKIATQRQRNIEKDKAEVFAGIKRNMLRDEYNKKFGVWL